VNKSLEGKLKCLIFIPIISQTYCDPTSFAWQNEFCAFNKLSGQDKFGRDIKLANGNVKSWILRVKIHDLDPEDRTVIECEIGECFGLSSLFLSQQALTVHFVPRKNMLRITSTFYRDQVNKVANAIKAIIQAAKAPSNLQPL
jgi:hypothetical protein